MLFEQPRRSELTGMPVGTIRGQYSKEFALLYARAAEEFPNIEVRIVANVGEKCFVGGGYFTVGEDNVGLDIIGCSDDNSENPRGSFFKRVKELQVELQNPQE